MHPTLAPQWHPRAAAAAATCADVALALALAAVALKLAPAGCVSFPLNIGTVELGASA